MDVATSKLCDFISWDHYRAQKGIYSMTSASKKNTPKKKMQNGLIYGMSKDICVETNAQKDMQ
eukprot:15337973-Ditylum_brightwellii.AAC.1